MNPCILKIGAKGRIVRSRIKPIAQIPLSEEVRVGLFSHKGDVVEMLSSREGLNSINTRRYLSISSVQSLSRVRLFETP